MWELYSAKLCGFLLPVNRQQTVELSQLSLPVLTEGGRRASKGTYHCTFQWAGVTVALWNCPASGQAHGILLFAKFLLGIEFIQGLGNFGPCPLQAMTK